MNAIAMTMSGPQSAAPVAEQLAQETFERELVLNRLHDLRRLLPAMAEDMVAARRQAARLRTDNKRLTEQVRKLRQELETRRRG